MIKEKQLDFLLKDKGTQGKAVIAHKSGTVTDEKKKKNKTRVWGSQISRYYMMYVGI